MDASEVQFLLSAPQAPGGYAAPGSVYNSLGRWVSTTQLNAEVTLNNMWPDLTGPQNAAGQVDYQCLFVFNPDMSATMANVSAWIPSTGVTGGVEWAVAADSTGATAYGAVLAPQAGYISSATVAPLTAGAWAGPSASAGGGAALPALAPGKVTAVWIRRTATGSPAFLGAGYDLQVTFDVIGG